MDAAKFDIFHQFFQLLVLGIIHLVWVYSVSDGSSQG